MNNWMKKENITLEVHFRRPTPTGSQVSLLLQDHNEKELHFAVVSTADTSKIFISGRLETQ
jgi:hypothetical protein